VSNRLRTNDRRYFWNPGPPDHTKISERWKAQYCPKGAWHCRDGDKTSKQIYDELVALGPAPNPSDIERIIGNDTWTK
jgi:hypothetical protein